MTDHPERFIVGVADVRDFMLGAAHRLYKDVELRLVFGWNSAVGTSYVPDYELLLTRHEEV